MLFVPAHSMALGHVKGISFVAKTGFQKSQGTEHRLQP